MMRVPSSRHLARSWIIGRVAPDFDLLDVWALPVEGARDEFAAFLDAMSSFDVAQAESRVTRALFLIRFRLGEWLGWDGADQRPIPGCTETTLAARLPENLRASAAAATISDGMRRAAGGFTPLYQTEDEWAAEVSNGTVHGVLHLSWVEERPGRYRPHMAVYVKPRGTFGRLYMALIQPFRHLIVYPALLRQVDGMWRARAS